MAGLWIRYSWIGHSADFPSTQFNDGQDAGAILALRIIGVVRLLYIFAIYCLFVNDLHERSITTKLSLNIA